MADENKVIKLASKRLRGARIAKGLTQQEVAAKAGMSETYYAQIERGEKSPTLEKFVSIIKVLGVSSEEILGK